MNLGLDKEIGSFTDAINWIPFLFPYEFITQKSNNFGK